MSSSTSPLSISVVIPTYERPDKLLATVDSVCDQSLSDFEVLVVDDGSESEQQRRRLSELEFIYDRVTVLRQENTGPAAARNRGWRSTDADIVLFTDDDCLVPDDWIASLLAAFEPGVGAVGGPLEPTDEAIERSVFARLHRHRLHETYDIPDEPIVGGDDLPMGGTANIAYRREALSAVDGFDETYPTAAGEDADLQTRVVDAGYTMKFAPTAVKHNDEYDWDSFKARAIRHGSGTYYYARRHSSPRPTWRVLAGLLFSPIFLTREIRAAEDVSVGTLAVVERMLARFGELKTMWDAGRSA